MANSFNAIQHPVYHLWPGTEGAMAQDATLTSEWLDLSGWAEVKVAWEIDSGGTVDADVDIQISSQGWYELRAKVADSTLSTDDYETVNLATAHTGTVYFSVDGEDVDELTRPIRSARIVIGNDEAEAITGFQVWVEGRS
jgi:hypothetical protein